MSAIDIIAALGSAISLPAMSGAEPWTGSNMLGNAPEGLRFADAANLSCTGFNGGS